MSLVYLRLPVAFLFALNLFICSLGWAGEITEKQILDHVVEQYGPVVNREKLPVLYDTVGKVFERISQAQAELIGSSHLSLNQLRIVDSPVLNAFVVTQKSDGVRRIHNHVFVTTGLLNQMFASQKPNAKLSAGDLKKGTIRVAGVLAHEISHPIEETDEESFKKNVGARTASQAREIRADSEGAILARKAGYPAESVYEGLSRLFEDPRKTQSMLGAAASTHPEQNLRLSTQRLLLTLNRYQQGKADPKYPEAVKPALIHDLQAVNDFRDSWAFEPPKGIDDIAKRLKGIPNLRQHETFKKVEYNRLILALDQMLFEKGDKLTAAEKASFLDAMKALASYDLRNFEVMPKSKLRKFLKDNPSSSALLNLPDHYEFMNRIPAYRNPEYLQLLRKLGPGPGKKWAGNQDRMLKMAPAEVLINEFKPQIIATIKENSKSFFPSFMYQSGFIEGAPLEWEVRLAELYHAEFAPQLTLTDRMRMDMGSTREVQYVLPRSEDGISKKQKGILSERALLMGDPRQRDLQALVIKHMKRIWDDRGYYAIADLGSSGHYDWEAVWSVLGIQPEVGRSQLRTAAKQFTASPRYAELIKTLNEGIESGIQDFKLLYETGAPTKYLPTLWLDDTLYPYLAGDRNPEITKDPALNSLAKRIFGGSLLKDARLKGSVYAKVYRQQFDAALKARGTAPLSSADLIQIDRSIGQNLFGENSRAKEVWEEGLIKNLDRIKIAKSEKAAALKELLIGQVNENLASWLKNISDPQKRTVAILKRYGVISSTTDLIRRYLASPERNTGAEFFRQYFRVLGGYQEDLARELESRLAGLGSDSARRKALLSFIEEFMDPGQGKYGNLEKLQGNSREVRQLKSMLLATAETLGLSPEENLRVFRQITATGPTQLTDIYFQKSLGSILKDALSEDRYKTLRTLAEQKRFNSTTLQVEIARKLLEGEITSLARRGSPASSKVESIVMRLNDYAPAGSLKKDRLLEEIAWKLNVQGPALTGLIEDEKSINWKKANPLLVNMGSAVGTPLAEMSESDRFGFIDYLLNPEGKELPPTLLKGVEGTLFSQLLKAGVLTPDKAREAAREGAYAFKYRLEAAMMDATPNERIPLFEMILSSGKAGPAHAADFPLNISRKYLGYAADSTEEKLLLAFLKVVPPQERSVTISYLLSQVGQNKSSVKNMFEVFQTVGIKFGQMTSIWKIFGEDIARETASLKDSAEPLTKAEIEAILDKSLRPEERARIKRLEKIIGSASLKTVAIAELTDGKEAVVLVQRPFADQQIKSNLDLSAKFLEELKRQKVDVPTGMFDAVIQDLRSQLLDETKMSDEADKIRQAQKLYGNLNSKISGRMNGYRFEVPGLVDGFDVRDHLLVIEKAEGVTWAKASPALRSAVGHQIAESSLRTLFREGWFDPDRHAGNVIIDEKSKVIRPIDFGQAEKYTRAPMWSSDDRYVFARFLKAIAEDNADELVEFGMKMVEKDRLGKIDPAILKRKLIEIQRASKNKTLSDKIIDLVNGFAENGAKFERKFSFGGLKGLMILHGENYVSTEKFADLMRQEIAGVLKEKIPFAIVDGAKGALKKCATQVQVFLQLLK